MARRSELQRSIEDHDRYIDSAVAALVARVKRITDRATIRATNRLRRELETAKGQVRPVAANQRALRSFAAIFDEELTKLGYYTVIDAFTRETFPGQAPFFTEAFDVINRSLKQPLPDPRLRPEDLRFITSQQISAGVVLGGEAARIGETAMAQALLSVGGTGIDALIEALADRLQMLPAKVESLSVTALTIHYRTLQDLSYRRVEEDSGEELLFRYFGPRDRRNRPFCRRVLGDNKPRSKKEVLALDNAPSSLTNAFLHGGGYRCRHRWAAVGFKETT